MLRDALIFRFFSSSGSHISQDLAINFSVSLAEWILLDVAAGQQAKRIIKK